MPSRASPANRSRPASRLDRKSISALRGSSGSIDAHLPRKVRSKGEKPKMGEKPDFCRQQRRLGQEDRAGEEQTDCQPNPGAEEPRRRADTDHGIVANVLQRVDRVVAHRPQNRCGVDQEGRPGEAAHDRRPAHEATPGEGEPENRLRP